VFVVAYLVINSVQKLLDTPLYDIVRDPLVNVL